MMKSSTVAFLAALLPLTSAHFRLLYPAVRGFDEDTLGNFPCGGQNVSPNRTLWPIKGGPIQLQMGHAKSSVEVLLGLGNDVGSSFNITLVPIFQEQGLGQFCMSSVTVPSDLKVTDGQNATIQVITNGDPSGGLYNCADITFTTGTPSPSQCANGTGVTAVPYTGKAKNANETDSTGATSASPSSGSTSATAAATAAATASATAGSHTAAAVRTVLGPWALGAGIVVGAVALL